jgi:hypothetical protein
MTRKDAIKLAQKAGFYITEKGDPLAPVFLRFAALVAEAERERMTVNSIHSCHPECDRPGCVAVRKAVEAEREACKKECDEIAERFGGTARDCSEAIRARGSK